LLTELPNKNCDTIAQAVPGTSEPRLQEFLTNMQWDEEDLNRQRVGKMVAEATLGDGVLVLDDTGLPKQGQASVGMARQYSGTLGKVGQLPTRGDLLLHGPPGYVASGRTVVLAESLGGGPRAPAERSGTA
jgi:DDE superfamily endonuclease